MITRILLALFFLIATFAIVAARESVLFFFGDARLDVFVVAVVYVSIILRYQWALALAVVGGFALDFFSLTNGAISFSLVFAVITVNYLFIHFFTNRSFWTLLLLGGIGTAIAFMLRAFFTQSFFGFFPDIATQLIVHTIAFILLFFFTNLFSARLKPYILLRNQ